MLIMARRKPVVPYIAHQGRIQNIRRRIRLSEWDVILCFQTCFTPLPLRPPTSFVSFLLDYNDNYTLLYKIPDDSTLVIWKETSKVLDVRSTGVLTLD